MSDYNDILASLHEAEEKLEKEFEEGKNEAIKEIILGIRMSFNVPSNMSDDDLRVIVEPYFEDDFMNKLGDTQEDCTMNLIIYMLKDLQSKGITIKVKE